MANHLPKRDAIDRRALLLGTAGALAAVAASAIERPNTGMQFAAKTVSTSEAPNLHPPVVQVKGGKLRGSKDGRVFIFLGIPYARAEWFEMPQAVPAWDGIKGAQVWGRRPSRYRTGSLSFPSGFRTRFRRRAAVVTITSAAMPLRSGIKLNRQSAGGDYDLPSRVPIIERICRCH